VVGSPKRLGSVGHLATQTLLVFNPKKPDVQLAAATQRRVLSSAYKIVVRHVSTQTLELTSPYLRVVMEQFETQV
jgi:hypothetical protein